MRSIFFLLILICAMTMVIKAQNSSIGAATEAQDRVEQWRGTDPI